MIAASHIRMYRLKEEPTLIADVDNVKNVKIYSFFFTVHIDVVRYIKVIVLHYTVDLPK